MEYTEQHRDHPQAAEPAKPARFGSFAGMALFLGCVLLISLGYAVGWHDRQDAWRALGI